MKQAINRELILKMSRKEQYWRRIRHWILFELLIFEG